MILAVLTAYTAVPAVIMRGWWVEDAAIAFAFARNLAVGDGLVAFPGGERVEGYSDPLWIAVLALGHVVGFDPFALSKILGWAFAAACVPLAWAIAKRIPAPEGHPRAAAAMPLLAAALVATNAQHAIWASAGLENALYSFLLAIGTLGILVESEAGGVPWSAAAFLGVALTRPEGAVYAGFAFTVGAWFDVRAGRYRRIAAWLALFAAPFAAYHAARYAYFALPYPMPYYAKIADVQFSPWSWTTRPWSYLRTWSTRVGWAWLLPVFFAGVAGTRGRRGAIAGVAFAVLTAILWLPGGTPVDHLRIAAMIAVWFLLPPLAPDRARLLSAGFAAITFAFAYRAGGDWMAGYRWFSALVVPISVIYAIGVAEIAARLRPKLAIGVSAALGIAPIALNIAYLVKTPLEPMTPQSTRTRVEFFDKIAARVHLDRPWVAVDHAMGGHLWWAPPDGRTIDFYGLTDIPFALHRNVRGFGPSYMLDPPTFDFAHLKGGLQRDPAFAERFVALPHAKGRTWDNWMNRSLVAAPAWPGDPAVVAFAGGQTLEGFAVRSPEVAAGGGLYVELGLKRDPANDAPFQVKVILNGPATAVFDAPPGYGDLFPPALWRADEVFVGKYAFKLPADLPAGTYAIGFAVLDERGVVEPALSAPEGASILADNAVVGTGEVQFAGVVQIVPRAKVRAAAEGDWTRAEQAAAAGSCAEADESWFRARDHEPLNRAWAAQLHDRAAGPLAKCWADQAGKDVALDAKLDDLRRARLWDLRSPDAEAAGKRVADATWPTAMAARESGDAKRAFALFDAIATADPSQSWARRYAEEARTQVLASRRR